MRDSKSISLLVLSSVLLLLSIGLLSSLGYQYYRQSVTPKAIAAKPQPRPVVKAAYVLPDSTSTRDSLIKAYNLALNNFDHPADSPVVTGLVPSEMVGNNPTLVNNLKEFYRLKDEIALLLQEKSSNADMLLAKQKIAELQLKVEILSYRNSDVEKENKRLYAMLDKLTRQSRDAVVPVFSVSPGSNDNRAPAKATAMMTATNLNLAARAVDSDEETTSANETETLVGSFTVSNKGVGSAGEIVVVVVQPNGQVLQKSAWESGAFETSEGKKIYSCKLRFDAARGETKQLSFSISADNYQKGNYTLQVYHNGVLIAKKAKTLS